MRSSTYESDSSDEDSPSPEHRRTTDEFNEQQEVMELQLQEAAVAAAVAAAEAEAAAETAVSSDAPAASLGATGSRPGSPRRAAAVGQGGQPTVQILTLDQPPFTSTANLPAGRSDSPDDFNASNTSLSATGLLKPSKTESRVGLLKAFSRASRAEVSDAVPAAAAGSSMSFSKAEAAEASRPSQVELVIKASGAGTASAIDRAADKAAAAEKAKEKEKGEEHG
jgi:hypothetical protein